MNNGATLAEEHITIQPTLENITCSRNARREATEAGVLKKKLHTQQKRVKVYDCQRPHFHRQGT